MNTEQVIIIGYCGPQLSLPNPACMLYSSSLIKKIRLAIHHHYKCDYYFLSPCHGIVHPMDAIAPYSHQDRWKGAVYFAKKKAEWLSKVKYDLYLLGNKYKNFLTFADKDLVKPFPELVATNKIKDRYIHYPKTHHHFDLCNLGRTEEEIFRKFPSFQRIWKCPTEQV